MSKSLVPDDFHAFPVSTDLRHRDERLESLKSLAGKLIHDFNNFLVPLLGYVALIKDELPADSSALVYANTLENTARKTEGFLDQVLTAVRPYRSFHPKPTDFSELVHSAVVEWKNALPAGTSIVIAEDLAPCKLEADEAQWKRVLTQLLANARFALATGGTLEIRLGPQTLSTGEMLDLNIAEPHVFRLAFCDRGFGMPPAVLTRACEPFFTTRAGIGAAGLGLTIAHSVTRLHGGQIQIESTEDVGTTVTIWIPASPARAPGMFTREEKKGGFPNPLEGTTRSRVLLIDDDPFIREVLKPCLLRTGYDVFLATNGEEGLKTFRKFPGQWALIICDFDLPQMNGWELLKILDAEDRLARVILVASDAQNGVDRRPEQSGELRPLIIKKPFTLKSFDEAVRTQLG